MILNINAEDSAVTLVLVGHGEDLEIFAVPALTNWNPGRIFFCLQAVVRQWASWFVDSDSKILYNKKQKTKGSPN